MPHNQISGPVMDSSEGRLEESDSELEEGIGGGGVRA